MAHPVVLPLSAAGLAVVGLAGLPALFALLSHIRKPTPKDNFYEDIDGKSTPEAIAAFSNRRTKATILILSILGSGLSAAISVLSTIKNAHDGLLLSNWLTTAAWVSYLFLPYGLHVLIWKSRPSF
jgi:hypothetical protein